MNFFIIFKELPKRFRARTGRSRQQALRTKGSVPEWLADPLRTATGDVYEVGLGRWIMARGLPLGEWSEIFEEAGTFLIMRVLEAPAEGRSLRRGEGRDEEEGNNNPLPPTPPSGLFPNFSVSFPSRPSRLRKGRQVGIWSAKLKCRHEETLYSMKR